MTGPLVGLGRRLPAAQVLADAAHQVPTYAEVGATLEGDLPAGYHHADVTHVLGHGRDRFDEAVHAVLSWQVHRRSGLRVLATSETVAPGVDVVSTIAVGPLRLHLPCRVVGVLEESQRGGFAYGALPGHPELGEEAFVVELSKDLTVRLRIRAFSRPGPRLVRAAGPIPGLAQRLQTRRYLRSLDAPSRAR